MALGPWLGLAGAVGMSLAGCPSPDVAGKYERFNEETEEDRVIPDVPEMETPTPPMPTLPGTGTEGDTESGGPQPLDIDGIYLVAVSTVVEPSLPLQFLADVDAELDLEGNGTVTVEFQPLSLDQLSTTEPREEVGDAVTINSDVTAYAFELPFGMLEVTGEANPITGAPISAEITLSASIASADNWCGTADGEVFSPLQLPLAGSTFGAMRLADRDERPADGQFPLSCDQVGG
ncbi:MAG: hypothetical protein AAGF11_38360 [Myxococcota bacterium]